MSGDALSENTRMGARERVRKYRSAQRAKGLRLIQMWVPDMRNSEFTKEVNRQCLALRGDPQETEVLDWMEQAMDYAGWK